MIEATIETQNNILQTIQGLLRTLLESGAVDALLVPMSLPTGTVAPMLVTDPDALHLADPLAPVLPINAARAASQPDRHRPQGETRRRPPFLRDTRPRRTGQVPAGQPRQRPHHRHRLPGHLQGHRLAGKQQTAGHGYPAGRRCQRRAGDPSTAPTCAPPARSASSPCPSATTWP